MKIKTKSGFVIDVNEKRAKDWRFTKLLAKWQKDETVLTGMSEAITFLLGEDGENALMEHVKTDDDMIPSELMISEFKEIMQLMGEKIKKSAHSPA